MKIIFFCILAIFISCNKTQQGPAETLTSFIEYRFSNNQTKEGLLVYMTSKASEEIQAMSEGDLVDLFKVEKYRKRNFKIVTEKCTEDKCFMTYILEYDVLTETKTRDFSSEVKKIAELQKINEQWKVSNIENVKTFVESIKPIEVQ